MHSYHECNLRAAEVKMAIESKTVLIPVRVTPTQAQRFRDRAEQQELRLSTWLRELGARDVAAAPQSKSNSTPE